MFKFAIFAAVSSNAQATSDKTSLKDQVKTARAFGLRHGGTESAGPYVLSYSRTGYESLTDAASDIPPLKGLLDDLSAGKFQVLVMDNFDRLGDVAPMLRTRFKKHKAQLVSARQSGGVVPAAEYDPYKDDTTDISIHVEGIIQSYRINKIRRGWNAGIPARIDKGLHPLSLPYGYKKNPDGGPALPIPEEIALLIKMKNWMLAGQTYTEICLRADKILPPRRAKRWARYTVKSILLNPYYAGVVRLGKLKGRIPQPQSKWRVGVGLHKPLWDQSTYSALQQEAKRRTEGKRNYHARYPFTGLTVCGICGSKISKHGISRWEYLACPVNGHFSMRYKTALQNLTDALIRQLKQYQTSPPPPPKLEPLREELSALQIRRTRVQEGYENGLYSATEASQRLAALEDDISHTQTKIGRIQSLTATREQWQKQMGGLQGMITKLPKAIQHGDPARINQLLTALIDKIILKGDTIEIQWRE